MAAGELLGYEEADVVSGALVRATRVAETHDDGRFRNPRSGFLVGLLAPAGTEKTG